MGSKKLVWCCIAGIVLGYLAPMVLKVARSTSLSVGMVVGLALGYLLDILDEKRAKNVDTEALSAKAEEANRLMERARAEVKGKGAAETDQEPEKNDSDTDVELSDEEQAAKLDAAEELLRKARERIK